MGSFTNRHGHRIVEDQEIVDTFTFGDTEIDIMGFNWNEDRKRWEYFDLWYGDDHLNPGEAWGIEDGQPTREQVKEFLQLNYPELL